MLLGIAELVLLGLVFDWAFRRIKLPGLIGLLLLGALAGPYALNLLNSEMHSISQQLRVLALIVILLRAGFEISRRALAQVGGRALMMSFIPCICEVALVTLAAPALLNITRLEAAMLGSVLAAVSPAVVVPLMIGFIEERRGARRGAPTLVLAGASCDDAVAIVLCTSFAGMYAGQSVNMLLSIARIPVAVALGIGAGAGIGVLLHRFFTRFNPRATKRVLIILGLAVLLLNIEERIGNRIPFSALLALMAIGFIILEREERMAHEISSKLGKLWIFAQLLLFTLVGAQVNLPVAAKAGLAGAAVIAIGLAGRTIGVQLCLLKSRFNAGERLFISIAYLPKATVQAAIGGVPLTAMSAAGMSTTPGELILAVAVLSIVLTAPLGALLISWSGKRLLPVCDGDSQAADAAFASD
jgi:solute carrier family 9B (sodium/hydrogen exchanger), member 1/2